MARVAFGTFLGVQIVAGTRTSPAAAIAADMSEVDVSLSRENWPAAGCTLSLQFSFDGGNSWVTKVGPTQIGPFVATPKQASSTPARIGWTWNHDVFGQPTHARGQIATPQTFTTDITLAAG